MIDIIQILNTDKVFYAIAMLSMNVGSRFVVQDISKLQERMLASTVAKRFVLFCMAFIATRDVILAMIITFVVVVLMQYLFNENSSLCVIPDVITQPMKRLTNGAKQTA